MVNKDRDITDRLMGSLVERVEILSGKLVHVQVELDLWKGRAVSLGWDGRDPEERCDFLFPGAFNSGTRRSPFCFLPKDHYPPHVRVTDSNHVVLDPG